ncbi:hypothetical protein PV11_04622 [Exophiala sideris]|uniref:Fe2OG dioxygenase domain-containing protein n=1 Tax=Exophiala sideris TaxID=1016849 RepID=A0A0D1YN39_9EURO|nr:hypothetical protein PV11_04622 [Exophiala sideris]
MPATVIPDSEVPVVDFSLFNHGTPEQRIKTAKDIVAAFKEVGFVYLVNHHVADEDIDQAFQQSARVFKLTQEELNKPEVARPTAEEGAKTYTARGYSALGREKVSQDVYDDDKLKTLRAVADFKEFFDIGADKGPPAVREPNRFPSKDAIPGFEDFMLKFFWECHKFGLDILRAIAIGFDIDEDYFVNFHQDADHLLRLLHYPAVERKSLVSGAKARIPAHSDFGSITVLFQDSVGGLQVEDSKYPGNYLPAPPLKGSAIVNIGDFLMRWSNNVLKSTLHRVVDPPVAKQLGNDVELSEERFSIPFFLQADRHKVIQCVPGLERESGPKYPPVTAMEYLNMRVAATFKGKG